MRAYVMHLVAAAVLSFIHPAPMLTIEGNVDKVRKEVWVIFVLPQLKLYFVNLTQRVQLDHNSTWVF